MNRQLDVLFVSPDSSFQAYQALSKDFSAIEPPTRALLLAQSCRAKGFGVGILDCGAERSSAEDSVKHVPSSLTVAEDLALRTAALGVCEYCDGPLTEIWSAGCGTTKTDRKSVV